MIEFEATFTKIDKDEMRAKLRSVGAQMVYPEFLMKRVVFKKKELFKGWVRVRQEADKVTLSHKMLTGTAIEDQHEVEVVVDNFEHAVELLASLNLNRTAYQESLREKWEFENCEVTIDTWPGIMPIVEIESDSEDKVRNAVAKLGFDYGEAHFGAVGDIYERELGIPKQIINNETPEITFEKPPRKEK